MGPFMSSTYFSQYPQATSAFTTSTSSKRESFSDEKQHLVRVYGTVFASVGCAAIGASMDLMYNVHGFLCLLGSVAAMAMMFAAHTQQSKLPWLFATALCMGCNMGPLINMAMAQSPDLVVTALVSTTAMFACLSAAAFVAPSKYYLWLGGLLSSAVTMLMLVGLMNIFFRSEAMASAALYLGLMVYCGYTLFDTQVILERMHQGDRAYVDHALQLFIDFVAMFIRILALLAKSNKREDNSPRRR